MEKSRIISLVSIVAIVGAGGAFSFEAFDVHKIRKGSALAKLIDKSSADVSLSELKPKAGSFEVPAWLRARYRKNHANLKTRPSAAYYPLALEGLYGWALWHQDLRPSPPGKMAVLKPLIGKNVRISGNKDRARSETDVKFNFADSAFILAASNNFSDGRLAIFFSGDAGQSWGQTTLPLLPVDQNQGDPSVDWRSDGSAWATAIGGNINTTAFQLRAYKSVDGARTWTFDATISAQQTGADKQMMCIDRSATSPYRDRIYVIWHDDQNAFVNFRDTSGWRAPIQVNGPETTGIPIGADIATNTAGMVFAVWPDTESRNLFVVESNDGGAHFGAPRSAAKTFTSYMIALPAIPKRFALLSASIAALKDAARNDVYVSWVDLSGDPGCDQINDGPGTNIDSQCKTRIWFARSSDGGTTWEKPKMINDEFVLNDQFHERLAVDPETGLLGVAYYQTGSGQDRRKTNVMFQSSTDNGLTWSNAIKVTTAPTDETEANTDANQYGEYIGLSGSHGSFVTSWTDRRDGKAEAIFAAKIVNAEDSTGSLRPAVVSMYVKNE